MEIGVSISTQPARANRAAGVCRLPLLAFVAFALCGCMALAEFAYEDAVSRDRAQCERLVQMSDRQACLQRVNASTRQAQTQRKKQ